MLSGFRSGTWVQSGLSSSYSSVFPARPLGSAVVTRFPATMGLSDSRPMPAHGYLFPPAVGRVATPAPPGIPVSSTNLSLCAVPNHPEKPSGVLLPLFHHWWQASPSLAGWPSFNLRHEAESGSLSLRLTGSPHEASPSGLLHSTLVRLHVERVIHMVDSFHSTRFASLLAHQRRKDAKKTQCFLCGLASLRETLFCSSIFIVYAGGTDHRRSWSVVLR